MPSKPVRRRSRWARLSAQPDVRSVQIAVLATFFFHLLLLWFAPRIERLVGHDDMGKLPAESDNSFEVQLAPDEAKPLPPPPLKFVEANPNAPENTPDKTINFAAQNQQVAQKRPEPNHKSDAPALKGDKDPDVTAIVTGQLAEPTLAAPPAPKPAETKPETPAEATARKALIPLSGVEKIVGDNPEGIGSDLAKAAPNATAVPEQIEGDVNAKADQGARHGIYYTVDAAHPKQRPTLAPNVVKARPSPLKNSEFGTDNIGAISYDAKWSSYGQYLQKFIDTVQVQWERILYQSNIYPSEGTKVTVVFRMNSDGKIYEIVKVEGSGGRAAQDACVSGITARDPYGLWTDDMISVLGKSQEFTFTFTYE